MTATDAFWTVLRAIVVGYFAIALVGYCTPRDDTDGEERSGMRLMTDARSGCQYLGAPWGGITPRMDRNGHHICGAIK